MSRIKAAAQELFSAMQEWPQAGDPSSGSLGAAWRAMRAEGTDRPAAFMAALHVLADDTKEGGIPAKVTVSPHLPA